MPERVRLPKPTFWRLPVPPTAPEKTTSDKAVMVRTLLMVVAPVNVSRPFFVPLPKMASFVNAKALARVRAVVPSLLNQPLTPEKVTVPVPSAALLPMCSPPAFKVVPPE